MLMRVMFFVGLTISVMWLLGGMDIDWLVIGFLLMTPETIATVGWWPGHDR